jgi:hypothetical protein
VAEFALALETAVGIETSRRPVALDACRPADGAWQKVRVARAELVSSWADILTA